MSDYGDWIGRTETAHDILEPARSNALLSALGADAGLAAGDRLPQLHHWLYFWNVAPPAGLGTDGHPARGGFLPPVELPRRMWAGGRLTFHAPLHLGERVERRSEIIKVAMKSGSKGDLLFVTVRHQLGNEGGLCISEEQDIVYLDIGPAPALPAADAPLPDAPLHDRIMPDTVLLFRYSALTMNGHRIHYDLPYAQGEELYPALVVHGPLQATLLAGLAARELGRPLAAFEFRGQSAAYAGHALHLCGQADGDALSLWTQQGLSRNMTATAR